MHKITNPDAVIANTENINRLIVLDSQWAEWITAAIAARSGARAMRGESARTYRGGGGGGADEGEEEDGGGGGGGVVPLLHPRARRPPGRLVLAVAAAVHGGGGEVAGSPPPPCARAANWGSVARLSLPVCSLRGVRVWLQVGPRSALRGPTVSDSVVEHLQHEERLGRHNLGLVCMGLYSACPLVCQAYAQVDGPKTSPCKYGLFWARFFKKADLVRHVGPRPTRPLMLLRSGFFFSWPFF